MIPGLMHGLIGQPPLTLAFQAEASSSSSTITWPSVQAGDLAVLFDFAQSTLTGNESNPPSTPAIPAAVTPSGFTQRGTYTRQVSATFPIWQSLSCRLSILTKLCDGTESGSLTGMNDQSELKRLWIFRPSRTIFSVSGAGFAGGTTSPRTFTPSGSPGVSLLVAAASAGAISSSPGFDASNGSGSLRGGYRIYTPGNTAVAHEVTASSIVSSGLMGGGFLNLS